MLCGWRTRVGFAAAGTLLLLGLLAGCGAARPAEELVQERCTRCHTLAPVEAARKTQQEWEQTVQRMIASGARLSDREADVVIDYLSRIYGIEP